MRALVGAAAGPMQLFRRSGVARPEQAEREQSMDQEAVRAGSLVVLLQVLLISVPPGWVRVPASWLMVVVVLSHGVVIEGGGGAQLWLLRHAGSQARLQ